MTGQAGDRACAASMVRAGNQATARLVMTRLDDRVAMLRQFVPWPALVTSWELERAEALRIMKDKGFT